MDELTTTIKVTKKMKKLYGKYQGLQIALGRKLLKMMIKKYKNEKGQNG